MALKTKTETLIYKIWNCVNGNPGINFTTLIKIFNTESYLTVCNTINCLVKRKQLLWDNSTYTSVGPKYMSPSEFKSWVGKSKQPNPELSELYIKSFLKWKDNRIEIIEQQKAFLNDRSFKQEDITMSLNTETIVENKEVPKQQVSEESENIFDFLPFTEEDTAIIEQLKKSFKVKIGFIPTTAQVILHSIHFTNSMNIGNPFHNQPQQQQPVMPPQWINPRQFTSPNINPNQYPGFNPNPTCDSSNQNTNQHKTNPEK